MSEQSQTFQQYAELARSCRDKASGLPAQIDVKPHWSGIGFSLLGKKFIAPIQEIAEVLEVPRYTHLPGVQGWVRGVSNVRGKLLPITDLASFLGFKLDSPRRQRRILILEKDELYSGLIVDSSFGMQHMPIENYSQDIDLSGIEGLEPYLQGKFSDDDGEEWVVFSPMALTSQESFYQAALG